MNSDEFLRHMLAKPRWLEKKTKISDREKGVFLKGYGDDSNYKVIMGKERSGKHVTLIVNTENLNLHLSYEDDSGSKVILDDILRTVILDLAAEFMSINKAEYQVISPPSKFPFDKFLIINLDDIRFAQAFVKAGSIDFTAEVADQLRVSKDEVLNFSILRGYAYSKEGILSALLWFNPESGIIIWVNRSFLERILERIGMNSVYGMLKILYEQS